MQTTPNDTNEHMEKTQTAEQRKKQIQQSHDQEKQEKKYKNSTQ